MERAVTLQALRTKDIKLPVSFDITAMPNQAHIIRWLLNHQPRERPTSMELLQSEYLPARIEDEFVNEALRTIANPNTPYFARLMSALHGQHTDKHKDFSYDFNSGAVQPVKTRSLVVAARTKAILRRVFARHGAVEMGTPLLTPKSRLNEGRASVTLLDVNGVLVDLPHDLTLPFARWVALYHDGSDTPVLKRWCIDKVYRQNVVGGQPRAILEADFDVVYSSSECAATYTAEVIKAATELLGMSDGDAHSAT